MIEKRKVEAIKKLYDRDKNETIEVSGEVIHGWSLSGENKHLHLSILSDREILKLYDLEDNKQKSTLKDIDGEILLNKIDKNFIETLKVEIHRASRFNLPLSIIYMEFSSDLAKKDLELKMVEYIKKIMRPTDFLASLNYNRYLILCTHTDKEHAEKFIERINHSIEVLVDIYNIETKFSITEFNGEATPEELLKRVFSI